MKTNTSQNKDWGRFDFLGVSKPIAIATVALVVFALGFIAKHGLNYGVDFSGGIELQVQFKQSVDAARMRAFMGKVGFENANVQALGDDHEYLVHIESPSNLSESETNTYIQATVEKLKSGFVTEFANEGPEIRRVDTVGPQVGSELKRKGILAAFYTFLLILIYVGLRFDYRYAPAAVFCLFHDAIITVFIYSIMDWEFTVQTLAAVLTIIGYSLNDTIVIFDRIRENIVLHRDKTLYWISNRSINETLSRTIITFITTMMMVLTMYIYADGAIQDFAKTMMIGMVLGVFSTVYVATPLMLAADAYKQKRRQRAQQAAYSGGK